MRNGFILVASVIFYSLGAGALTFIAFGLLIANWVVAAYLSRQLENPQRKNFSKLIFALSIAMNLLPLAFFKYLIFFIQVVNDVLGVSLHPVVGHWNVVLPLGISFYTFHFMSYLTDVYRRQIAPEPSLHKFAIYIFLFPHLIAGPVVRFSEVKQQLDVKRRKLVRNDVFWGMVIFVIGLAKKILIADPLGSVTDSIYNPTHQLTTYSAWLGAISYSFQIYFDFSGYTDMAIGMARMLGFRFPRNFNRPYAALSITEFWQRWHMTLSRWFRDYVYIPLGGNRTTPIKIYRNLFLVFLLCGLWHGAAYTFLIWGLGHGCLIVLERTGLLNTRKLRLASIPVFVFATVLWVPFRAESVAQMNGLLLAMTGLDSGIPLWVEADKALADFKVIFILLLALAICLVSDKFFYRWRLKSFKSPNIVGVYILILYVVSCISVVERGFNPFIYFKF